MNDIIINKAILHIIDKSVFDTPILSDREFSVYDEIDEFLTAHITKVLADSSTKRTQFMEDGNEKKAMFLAYLEGNLDFIDLSMKLSQQMHHWVCQSIDAPSGDFVFMDFFHNNVKYVGGIKLDYKDSYIHKIESNETTRVCNITKQKAVMPNITQTISEAFFVNCTTLEILVKEKKYKFEPEMENYISSMVLQAKESLSDKQMLKIVTDVSKKLIKENYGDPHKLGEAKEIITKGIYDDNKVDIEDISDKLFHGNDSVKKNFVTKVRESGIREEVVEVRPESLKKSNRTQRIVTSDGIEIVVPVSHMSRKDKIEFITNFDGSISIILKNIEKIENK